MVPFGSTASPFSSPMPMSNGWIMDNSQANQVAYAWLLVKFHDFPPRLLGECMTLGGQARAS